MKVWIDLFNSPHPLLFAPVTRRLKELGHEVVLTARDNAQTAELARERWPDIEVIGGESPRSRAGKVRALLDRTRALRAWARTQRPDIALSHNSYGQIMAARSLGLRVVTAMDFEHQPANHLAFRLAHRILLPEAIARADIARQGARDGKVWRYPGLKEQLYLADFTFNPSVVEQAGVVRCPDTVLVVARTPPSRATYHRFGNRLFERALVTVCAQPAVRCVLLTRHAEQRALVTGLALSNCTVPSRALDSRSLMYAADLVLGAGGTMTREAALMGLPTYTLFAGESPAVDRWLIREGRLKRLADAKQVGVIRRRAVTPASASELRRGAEPILERFVAAAVGP